MKQSLRTKIAKRVCVRVPHSSQSLRAILQAICDDPETSINAVVRLGNAVTPKTDDLANWDNIIAAVGKPALLRALLTIVRQCETGPYTAYAITEAYAELQARRARLASDRANVVEEQERALQQLRQDGLARVADEL